jgi:cobalt-zinc-cadmium efflux system membrane fusion protein
MKNRDHRTVARQHVFAGLLLLLIGTGLGAGMYRLATQERFRSTPLPNTDDSAPQLVRQNDRIIIPDNSPLRSQLTVEPVSQKEIKRNLTLPAVVEADPARLVRILPPLAGRITQLNVQLGQRIEQHQPLAVLDSPDLQTAYADYGRGKVQLANSELNRDRLRSLGARGGIAEKDIQQAGPGATR